MRRATIRPGTLVAALAAPLLGGCVFSYGFGVGPTVDTNGEVGAQLSLRGRIGAALGDEDGLYEGAAVAGAPPGVSPGHVTPVVFAGYVHEFTDGDDEWAIATELRARFQLEWDDGNYHAWVGGGGSIAFLPTLDVGGDSDEFTHLGVELEGYFVSDDAAEVPEGETAPSKGIFGVSLVFEKFIIEDDDDFFGWDDDW